MTMSWCQRKYQKCRKEFTWGRFYKGDRKLIQAFQTCQRTKAYCKNLNNFLVIAKTSKRVTMGVLETKKQKPHPFNRKWTNKIFNIILFYWQLTHVNQFCTLIQIHCGYDTEIDNAVVGGHCEHGLMRVSTQANTAQTYSPLSSLHPVLPLTRPIKSRPTKNVST